jgi:hypothetical protein
MWSRSRVSHSHITPVRHPKSANAALTRRSRSRVLRNLSSQKAARVLGQAARRQPSWRCQKQPFTNSTNRLDGKTRSGVPGRSRRCIRKRYPSACAIRRTVTSARVSTERTLLMLRLRVAASNRSTIKVFPTEDEALSACKVTYKRSTLPASVACRSCCLPRKPPWQSESR